MGAQQEIHEHQAQYEDQHRLVTTGQLLPGQAREFIPIACGKGFGRDFLYGLYRIAGAIPGVWCARDCDGREEVKTVDEFRAIDPFERHEFRDRRHDVIGIPHEHLVQALDIAAVSSIRLDHDPVLFTEFVEVGRIDTPIIALQGAEHGGGRNIGFLTLGYVDQDLELREIDIKKTRGILDLRSLVQSRQKSIVDLIEMCDIPAAPILYLEFEPAGIAKPFECRRGDEKDLSPLDPRRRAE